MPVNQGEGGGAAQFVAGERRARAYVVEAGVGRGGLQGAVDLVRDAVQPVLVGVENPAVAQATARAGRRGSDEQVRIAEHNDLGVGCVRLDRREELRPSTGARRVAA